MKKQSPVPVQPIDFPYESFAFPLVDTARQRTWIAFLKFLSDHAFIPVIMLTVTFGMLWLVDLYLLPWYLISGLFCLGVLVLIGILYIQTSSKFFFPTLLYQPLGYFSFNHRAVQINWDHQAPEMLPFKNISRMKVDIWDEQYEYDPDEFIDTINQHNYNRYRKQADQIPDKPKSHYFPRAYILHIKIWTNKQEIKDVFVGNHNLGKRDLGALYTHLQAFREEHIHFERRISFAK